MVDVPAATSVAYPKNDDELNTLLRNAAMTYREAVRLEQDRKDALARTNKHYDELIAFQAEHLDEQMAIVVGGRVIATRAIKTTNDHVILIDGGFSRAEAEAVLARIRRGGA